MTEDSIKLVQPSVTMTYSLVTNHDKDIVIAMEEASAKVKQLMMGLNEKELCTLIKDTKSASLFKEYLTSASDCELGLLLTRLSCLSTKSIISLLGNPLAHQTLEELWNISGQRLPDRERIDFAHSIVHILREGHIGAVSLTSKAILFVGTLVSFVHSVREELTKKEPNGDETEKWVTHNDDLDDKKDDLFLVMQKLIALRLEQQKNEEENEGRANASNLKRSLYSSKRHSNEGRMSPKGSPHKSPRKDWREPVDPLYGYCEDDVTLARREKEVEKGRNTEVYREYLLHVPKHKRVAHVHPRTPNKHVAYSRRAWDGLVRQWRLALHTWKEVDDKYMQETKKKQSPKKNSKTKKNGQEENKSGCKPMKRDELENMAGPPFVCSHCDQQFMFRSTLITHGMNRPN